MYRLITHLILAAVVVAGALLPLPAQAEPRTRCFPETGYCVADPFLAYWEQQGGLPVFGYPISDVHIETAAGWTGPVQWFERNRLEDHGPAGVMSGRVGVLSLLTKGILWDNLPRVAQAPAGCRFFPQTGHSLCGDFRDYWERNGGLTRFGYPISEPLTDLDPAYPGRVQLFERARMEYHPELAGTEYAVLLGLIGRELSAPPPHYPCAVIVDSLAAVARAFPDVLHCPSIAPRVNVPMATQPFERGTMTWVGRPDGQGGSIWVVYFDSARGTLVWESYPDNWREGDPERGGATPPAGLFEPIRGFGKLWRENEHVRNTLGWATAPEQADRGDSQYFRGGAWGIYRAGSDRVYVLYPDGRAADVARMP